jgi:hypothetical protein
LGGDEGVGGAADAEDAVPEADGACGGGGVAGEVDLEEDGAGEDGGDGDEEVAELGGAALAWVADLDDGLWVGGVGEEGARGGDYAEDFADEARAGWDVDG